MKPLLVVLAGPTAIGKTSMAIRIANAFGTEIVSADSRQIYSELNIGVARPTADELKAVTHHMIGTQSIHQYYNVSMYEQDVLLILKNLFTKYPMVVLTGGSGFYIDALCNGIDDLPTILPEIRSQIENELQQNGLKNLLMELEKTDPEYYQIADLNNPKRITKAIEVFRQTGRTYSSFLTRQTRQRPFNILKISLDLPRDILHKRINQRVLKMMQEGLLQEAEQLFTHKHLNALNTVGYKEIFEYMEGKYSLEEAISNIQANTRQYARRQLTWFRRDKSYHWFTPNWEPEIMNLIQKNLYHGT